ncbi:MAG: acetylglutamate kinase [Phycisphaerales bacterium]
MPTSSASTPSQTQAPSRPGPVVVKIGGTGVEQPQQSRSLWDALRTLNQIERREGRAGVVLVHGGGKAVDALMSRLGFVTERYQGLRITPPEQMTHIAAALTGINKSIVAALSACGQPALGLCPGECATATLRRLTPDGVDIGLVGEITGGDPAFIRETLAKCIVPVFSPVGMDAAPGQGCGGLLNVNADDVAAGLAAVLGASLLVLLTDVPGVRGADGTTIARADSDEVEALIASGVIHGGMVPKVRAALRAAALSGAEVLITSWERPETLATIHEQHSIGTRITAASAEKSPLTPTTRPVAAKENQR